jgi:hypothetical protein
MNRRSPRSCRLFPVLAVVAGSALGAASALAQDNPTPASTAQAVGVASTVLRLIKFSEVVSTSITGADQNDSNVPQPVSLPITFSLYDRQEGRSPLWSETQSLRLDSQGRYTVLLGAASASGLPLDLFTSGKAFVARRGAPVGRG